MLSSLPLFSGQGHQLLAGVVGVGAADDLAHLLVEHAGVQAVGALEDEVAVVEELGREVGLAEGLAAQAARQLASLRARHRLPLEQRPSLTGTEVATWSVVSRRIVFWRMK